MIQTYDHARFDHECRPFADVLKQLREDHEMKFDELLSLPQLHLDDELRLVHNGARLTPRGLASLAHLVEIPPAAVHWLKERQYDRELSHIVNDQLMRLRAQESGCADRRVFSRFRGSKDANLYLRALFSDRFCPVDSLPALEMVREALTDNEFNSAHVHRLSYDGDELFCNILWSGGDRNVGGSSYACGIALQNGEVGTIRLKLAPVVLRKVCSNGLVVQNSMDVAGVSKRHVGRIDMNDLAKGIRAALGCALEVADQTIIGMEAARNIPVEDATRAIAQVSREMKLTREQTRAWLDGHDATLNEPGVGEVSVFSIVNGLTKGAQNPGFEPTSRVFLETVAGRILAPSPFSSESAVRGWWNELEIRARSLSDEVLASYL
ncbi:MAG: DUF932 domain-containing protein [Methanoregulaceae archaeon]|nr:DUF932 domain-containing protein [Methanoregulaceae archaeon]